VLRQLGIDPDAGQRILEIWNKIDRFDPGDARKPAKYRRAAPAGTSVFPSRRNRARASTRCGRDRRPAAGNADALTCIDPPTAPASAGCHRNSEVLNKELHDGRFDMTVRIDETKHISSSTASRGGPRVS